MRKRLRTLVSRIVGYYTQTAWKTALVSAVLVSIIVLAGAVWTRIGIVAAAALSIAFLAVLLLIGGTPTELRAPGNQRPDTSRDREPVMPVVVTATPTVSIVVAAKNEARFICDCLDSVAAQTYPDFECLVIDDASTDDTVSRVIDRYAPDQRFRFFSNDQSLGLAAVRNQGIDMARGEFVTFLDGDDLLYPEALECRITPMLGATDPASWLAGTYCDWRAVPESFELEEQPGPRPDLERVTWLSALNDAPFIASAPLLRTDVARTTGGFDADLETAEDAVFWNRLLRGGYVIDPVASVGVAYRQKRASMFRATTEIHASTITRLVESNYEPADAAMFPVDAPHPYLRPAGEYLARMTEFRRLVAALAIATETGDRSRIESAFAAVEDSYEPFLRWVMDLPDVARRGAWRATMPAPTDERRGEVGRRVTQLLDRLEGGASVPPAPRPEPRPGPVGPGEPAPLQPTRRPVTVASRSQVADRVALFPSAGYHVVEVEDIAAALRERGTESVIVVPDHLWARVAPFMHAWPGPTALQAEVGDWVLGTRAVVTLNDWGPIRPTVQMANDAGIPTFGKVEGVQDFADTDVPFDLHQGRQAYRTVHRVLAQGRNDVEALRDQSTVVVGSTRLERIWLGPPRTVVDDLAVINVNFTYGVLDEVREMWVESAVRGCERAGLRYVLSLHPAERNRYRGMYPIADQPVRHLLTRAGVLISRFSTVPFEAMARGVPFVYHNPHQERVPTFKDPGGAFEVSDDVPSLVEALGASAKWMSSYRDRAADFFLQQVDVDPDRHSGERAADVILAATRR